MISGLLSQLDGQKSWKHPKMKWMIPGVTPMLEHHLEVEYPSWTSYHQRYAPELRGMILHGQNPVWSSSKSKAYPENANPPCGYSNVVDHGKPNNK